MSSFNVSAWALRNRSFVYFLMLAVSFLGYASYNSLGRNEDPAFTFRTMIVQAAWPGATLNDTMQQVTERLERTLQETEGLDFLRSYTKPGMTTIFVNLKGSVPPKAVHDTWYQVRKRIGDMRRTLPTGIVGPGFNDEFGDTFGIIYGFIADGFTPRELRDHVEEVRSELLHVPDVTRIDVLGAQDEQIYVEFSMKLLASLGIDRSALVAALQAQNSVSPAGIIQSGDEAFSLRVSGAFGSEKDIRDITFNVGGRNLRLSDIATVHRGYIDPPQPMFRVNGHPAIGLAIAMRDGGDVLALGDNIRRTMARITADLPVGIEVVRVADQPVTVRDAISEFMESLWQAIAIILVVSFISLGARAGTVIALTIPLTLALIFPLMQVFDIDLQRISLGALIIALALMVDDAMTTIDAMSLRLAEGDDRDTAASYAYTTLAFPMLTGSFVTMAGFIPIGFARSSAGEYTFSIFAVVSFALIVSWFVAVLFAPVLGAALLRPPSKPAAADGGWAMRTYRRALLAAMRGRWITLLITVGFFVAAIAALPLIPRQFFPSSDRVELLVDLRLPQNASIHATADMARRFDAVLGKDPDVAHWSTYVGRGAQRFYLPLNVQLPNDFFAQAVLVAKDIGARQRLQKRLESLLAESFPDVVARVYPLEMGPPVGWPVQYRVSGPDPDKVRDIALRLAEGVSINKDLRSINFDWMEPARELRIRVDQDEARRLGISSQSVATVLNAAVTGTVVTQVRDGIYLVDVVARSVERPALSPATLRTLQVPIPGGRTVPLGLFATIDYGQEFPVIWRRDRVPTLTVQADVAPGVLPAAVVETLEPAVARVQATLPAGYAITVGGIVEESGKSQASVMAIVPAMLFITLTILMIQLRNFQRLFIVLSVVPLGLIGVVAGLLIPGVPLGFVAILGILALIGMIARNAVILIEQVEVEREEGRNIWDAAVVASTMRFRPIVLTAISTVLGMIPIAVTVFWGPMAFAIMGGLLMATILTLIFLPTLYVVWFGGREEPVRDAASTAAKPGAAKG